MLIENSVVVQIVMSRSIFLCGDCYCLHVYYIVYMYITLFTDILTLECMLGHQSLGVCEVLDPYPLYSLKYSEKHIL